MIPPMKAALNALLLLARATGKARRPTAARRADSKGRAGC
jgi:hypothetical protein